MVLLLNQDKSFSMTNFSSILSNTSIAKNITFYVSKTSGEWDTLKCGVLFCVLGQDTGKIVFTRLENAGEYKNDYYKFRIPDSEDFALASGTYNCWITLLDYSVGTKEETNQVAITVSESGQYTIESNLSSNDFKSIYLMYSRMKEMSDNIDSTLDKITKLTKINIDINKEINGGK